MPVGRQRGHCSWLPTPDLPVSMSSSEQQQSTDVSVCQEGEGQNWRGRGLCDSGHSSVRQLGAGSKCVGSPDRLGSGQSNPDSSLSPLALFLPDLSFNNIEAIEGLDTLVNLEDLSLFNNRISKIDSLDSLVKLQVLSLGNNQIGNIMNVSELRPRTGLHGAGAGVCAKGKRKVGLFNLLLFLEKPETQLSSQEPL